MVENYFVVLFIIVVCATVIYSRVQYNSLRNLLEKEDEDDNDLDIELVNTLLSDKTVENIDTMVDQFIINAGNMYTLLVLSQDSIHYISEEAKDEMSAYIFGTVKKNMTPTVRKIIGLTHIVDTEEELNKYLNLRIKLYVLNFMVNFNRVQE